MTYPTIMPALTLDFQNSQQLDPRVTFSRSSGATYINSAGSVVSAANHEPRFDHDPETGKCLGLLIEESRTNLFLYGTDFSLQWPATFATKTQNAAIAPDGTTTACKLTPNATFATHYMSQTQTVTTASFSVFAKADGYDYARVYSSNGWAQFNLVTGAVVQESTVGIGSIEPFPNGWYRLKVQNVSVGAATNYRLYSDESVGGANYAGDGVSGTLFWGAQLEDATFPTSYIPTAGSAVTRSADIAQITGDNFSSWYNDSEATIVSTQIDADSGTGYGVVWGFGTGGTNRIELRQRSQEFKRGFYINGGNMSAVPLVYTKTSHAQQYTVGVAINASGADYAAEGVGVAGNTFTNATMPVIGTLYLSLGTVVDIASKTIARLSYYNERLTDAELQTITS